MRFNGCCFLEDFSPIFLQHIHTFISNASSQKESKILSVKKDNNIKIYFFANATIKRKHKKEKKRQNIFILPKLQNMFPNLSLHRKKKDKIEFKNEYFLKNEKI